MFLATIDNDRTTAELRLPALIAELNYRLNESSRADDFDGSELMRPVLLGNLK